jgi:PAS domain S-box-containing protein
VENGGNPYDPYRRHGRKVSCRLPDILDPTKMGPIMRRFKRSSFYALLWLITFGLPIQAFGTDSVSLKPGLHLTPEEQSWLDQGHIVRARVASAPPLHFFDGQFQGISVDYLNLIAERAGFKVRYVTGIPWSEALAHIENHAVNDLLLTAKATPERRKRMAFTQNYLLMPWVIFTRKDRPVETIDALIGKTVSVERDYVMHKKLVAEYPGIELLVRTTSKEAIEAVAFGQAEAYVGNLTTGAYIIQQGNLTNLQVAAPTPFDNHNQAMAIRDDWTPLVGIINKAFDAITQEEHAAINRKWSSIEDGRTPGRSKTAGAAPAASADVLKLNPKERNWLEDHPVIRVHNELDWPPFNYFEYGDPKGLSIDYMNLMAERLGITVEYVTGPNWNEFLGMIQLKKLDVMLNIVKTEDRQKYLLYSEPYIKNPNVIVSSKSTPHESIEDLFGKTVAFPKGFFHEEILTKSFPRIKRLPVMDTLASLKAVSFGNADAALGEEAVVRSLMAKNMLTGLHISGEVKLGNPDLDNLRIGIRNDWPLLHSAMMKAMASVSPQQMNELSQKWLAHSTAEAVTVPLTDAETAWIQAHPRIKVNGGEWAPFILRSKDGETNGISSRILNLAASRVGLEVDYVDGPWPKMQEMIKNGELDLLQCVSKTPARDKYLHFTEPYMTLSDAIFVQKGDKTIGSILDLKGKRLAVADGTHLQERLNIRYPVIQLVPVKSALEGLRNVSNGETIAYIGPQIVTQYQMQKRLIQDIKIAAYFDDVAHDLRFGAPRGSKVLADIMQKALNPITESQKSKIISSYIIAGDEAGGATPTTSTDAPSQGPRALPSAPIPLSQVAVYSLIVFVVVSLLALVLIWTLRRENVAIRFGSPWFRGLVLTGLSLFVLIVAFLGWYNLERNKTQHLEDMNENLKGLLSVSQDRLDLWMEDRISDVARLGRDPKLVAITRRLLQVKPNKRALLASSALREARFFFEHTEGLFSHIGFFIIDPNHVSFGSMRDANLGTRNLIAEQHPELLKRAFQGEVGFVPPITSDVHLGALSKSGRTKKPPTMFFIGPVKDTNGRVLAVMTLRVNPWEDFDQALKPFRGTETGEAYAFDRNGCLLSMSRFEDQLRRIGLLAEDQSSALRIEIRDPGVNMVEGHRPKLERSKRPLTHMASRAVALRRQMKEAGVLTGPSPVESNMAGYSDYRGVKVFGAWLWNADLDMGLAIEIDVDEALEHFYQTRFTIFGILGFTLFLSVGAILFVLIIGERTSRALEKSRDNLEEKVAERTLELTNKQDLLALSEERTRLLLDSVGEGIFGVDLDGKVMFINAAATRLLGYAPDELIGAHIHAKAHHTRADGSPYPAERCPMARAYTHGETNTIVDEMLWRKDGTGFPVEYTATPVVRDGEITGAVIAFRDITERLESEKTIRHHQKQMEAILDGLNVVAFMKDLQGRYLLVNQFYTEAVGVSKQDAVGKTDFDILPRETAESIAAVDEQVISSGKVQRFEEVVPHPDGSVRTYLSSKVPLFDGDGHVYGLCGAASDITDRKRMEDALASESERLQGILDASPVGVTIITKGTIRFANPRFTDMFGVGAGDASPDLYVHADEGERGIDTLTVEGRVENLELQMFDRNHQVRDMLISAIPMTHEGEEGILGWLLDITDRKQAEKEIKERFDELTRFRRLAVGREKKMIELKKEINAMAARLGQDSKYKIVS